MITSTSENGACLPSSSRRGLENLLVARLGLLQVLLEVERLEEDSRTLVELGLELDPVQPERVEEGAHALHDDQDRQGEDGPEAEDDVDGDGADVRLAEAAGEADAEDELPQNLGELRGESDGLENYFGRLARRTDKASEFRQSLSIFSAAHPKMQHNAIWSAVFTKFRG